MFHLYTLVYKCIYDRVVLWWQPYCCSQGRTRKKFDGTILYLNGFFRNNFCIVHFKLNIFRSRILFLLVVVILEEPILYFRAAVRRVFYTQVTLAVTSKLMLLILLTIYRVLKSHEIYLFENIFRVKYKIYSLFKYYELWHPFRLIYL